MTILLEALQDKILLSEKKKKLKISSNLRTETNLFLILFWVLVYFNTL